MLFLLFAPSTVSSSRFCELSSVHQAPTGVSAYAIDPEASDGGSPRRFEGAMGVTFSDDPQLLTP